MRAYRYDLMKLNKTFACMLSIMLSNLIQNQLKQTFNVIYAGASRN